MTNDIHQLIAAINPDVFCEPSARRQVKHLLQIAKGRGDSCDYAEAAGKAVPVKVNRIALDRLELENPFRLPGFKRPVERHTLVYDSFDDSLEAFYFWLLDELTAEDWRVTKLTDTFSAAPGSGLFSDLSRREIQAQHEATKLLREAQALVQDMLRTAAALRHESDPEVITIASNSSRSEVERGLLRSKVETLKLYARWLGPYLRQARQLAQRASGGAALVNLFNTTTAEITLLAQKEYDVKVDVDQGELPKLFLKAKRRDYFPILIIELKLRTAPERTSPGAYGYRGRFELTLTSYALNADELKVLRRELDRENLDEVIQSLGEGSNRILNDLVKQVDALFTEPRQTVSVATDSNPFFALFDFSEWFGSSEKNTGSEPTLRPDSEIEEIIRSQTILEARRRCYEFYTRCKQALRMPWFNTNS